MVCTMGVTPVHCRTPCTPLETMWSTWFIQQHVVLEMWLPTLRITWNTNVTGDLEDRVRCKLHLNKFISFFRWLIYYFLLSFNSNLGWFRNSALHRCLHTVCWLYVSLTTCSQEFNSLQKSKKTFYNKKPIWSVLLCASFPFTPCVREMQLSRWILQNYVVNTGASFVFR